MTQQLKSNESDDHLSGQPDTSSGHVGAPGNRTPLFKASHAARYQRQEIIKRIQEQTKRRLICYVSGSKCMIDWNDTMPFVDLLQNVKAGEGVELLLHTPGGIPDAAVKLIRLGPVHTS